RRLHRVLDGPLVVPGARRGAATGGGRVDVRRRVTEIRQRIATVGDPERVRIVAVTKGFGANAVDAALRAGITDIGESYAQELVGKAPDVTRDGARWHFIGRLQTNKV